MSTDLLDVRLQQMKLKEQEVAFRKNLPHLHGWKWYPWARKFFESRNHFNFLCAANQISKSSTQIRKAIHWATAVELWNDLWSTRPFIFWYFYPNKSTATEEFEKKWVTQFLPKAEFKKHPRYGWREEYKDKQIYAIHFNTGVTLYFKSYAQDEHDLQSSSVDAMFCDEELPADLYSELQFRLTATDGYFHMVFTATLGQEFWRLTIEERGEDENFKDAFKLQVSMYDCLFYEDGMPSRWTHERIERIKNGCKSEAEIQRRVYGRFVVDGGLKYPSFERNRNINRQITPIPHDWLIYTGCDIGSGGEEAHPAAIAFVAVRPDMKFGRVFLGWRGDSEVTTAGDVLLKHEELRGSMIPVRQNYDWAAKDFSTIATRLGKNFQHAEKSHEIGESMLNVLFKNRMLVIDDEPELRKLVGELTTLKKATAKSKAKDDFIDAMRYAVTTIPWDFTAITGEKIPGPDPTTMSHEERDRRGLQTLEEQLEAFSPEEELDAWDELMDI